MRKIQMKLFKILQLSLHHRFRFVWLFSELIYGHGPNCSFIKLISKKSSSFRYVANKVRTFNVFFLLLRKNFFLPDFVFNYHFDLCKISSAVRLIALLLWALRNSWSSQRNISSYWIMNKVREQLEFRSTWNRTESELSDLKI